MRVLSLLAAAATPSCWAFVSHVPRMSLAPFPYESVIPFLAEHVQPSDQVLILGATTDLAEQLSRNGYGTRDERSFLWVVDDNEEAITSARASAEADATCAKHLQEGNLRFQLVPDLTELQADQSCVDSVIDAGALDNLLLNRGVDAAGKCIDAAHIAVRLGNPMVCISYLEDKSVFMAPFDARFGWMQELDGDPGAVTMWYRGKVNIKDVASDFQKLGIKFFVYTNVDNC
ncbi:unnamed protein product [Chrysoparadoxa australica]